MKAAYFYQLRRNAWKIMDHNYKDIGRIKELSGGRIYVRCAGNRSIVQATLSDVQTDLVQ